MTLYTFDKGIDCIGVCLANWTPLAAPALARSWGDWTAVERADGSRQRAHKGQVLYLSGRDASPGDIAGEDTAHGWRAAIVRPAAGVPDGFIQQTADLGRVVADAGGLTVYTMAESPLRPKFCDDACLKTEWRPVAAGGGGRIRCPAGRSSIPPAGWRNGPTKGNCSSLSVKTGQRAIYRATASATCRAEVSHLSSHSSYRCSRPKL